MPRFFIEVAYDGTRYHGSQIQKNATTIQSELEKAAALVLRKKIELTGSSRTDKGVHAVQNFYHFDLEESELTAILQNKPNPLVYQLNAVLPPDICVKDIYPVNDAAHCRFDALWREYHYYIYQFKNPFWQGKALYFPYRLEIDLLQQAAELLKEYTDFTSFSKSNTQVKTFYCTLLESEWEAKNRFLVYRVRSNRFLRGMVRALVATMLKVGRKKINPDEFRKIIESRVNKNTSFAAPAHGLYLMRVAYPEHILDSRTQYELNINIPGVNDNLFTEN
ncbi:MAG: tRNA pseudouridine(38-40) synthase TruA [Chitinophagaceae bacterium]|nr:tRNA pseudouridine(38-40) synthase TruA [Chitinophagaceae bacterium]